MAMTNAKCFNSPKLPNPTKLATKSTSLFSFQNLPKGLTSETTTVPTNPSTTLAGTAIAGRDSPPRAAPTRPWRSNR
ncbi:hypothetical protein K1719_042739 [Acacia pycnantha]|nr:hypothetical protein K1719_042739 [Acacia pycnantha]